MNTIHKIFSGDNITVIVSVSQRKKSLSIALLELPIWFK